VHVQIDETGHDQEPARVDDFVTGSGRESLAHRDDTAAAERDIAHGMEALRRIDDGTALDQHMSATMLTR